MKKFWAFLSQPQNLAVFIALAGALAFLWKEVLAPKPKPPAAPSAAIVQQATTSGGSAGTAVNAAGSARVIVNQSDPPNK